MCAGVCMYGIDTKMYKGMVKFNDYYKKLKL